MGNYKISDVLNKYDTLTITNKYVKLDNRDGFEEKEIQTKNINCISLQHHTYFNFTYIIANIILILISYSIKQIPTILSSLTTQHNIKVTNEYLFIMDWVIYVLIFSLIIYLIIVIYSRLKLAKIIIETGSSKDKIITKKNKSSKILHDLKNNT